MNTNVKQINYTDNLALAATNENLEKALNDNNHQRIGYLLKFANGLDIVNCSIEENKKFIDLLDRAKANMPTQKVEVKKPLLSVSMLAEQRRLLAIAMRQNEELIVMADGGIVAKEDGSLIDLLELKQQSISEYCDSIFELMNHFNEINKERGGFYVS